MKRCTGCEEELPRSQFHANRARADGLAARCKACRAAYGVTHYLRNRDRVAVADRLRRYGLTPEDFATLLAAQGGGCAICKVVAPRWHVDHDHQSGAVRGVLCAGCNVGLGHFRDSPESLREAAAYLEHTT